MNDGGVSAVRNAKMAWKKDAQSEPALIDCGAACTSPVSVLLMGVDLCPRTARSRELPKLIFFRTVGRDRGSRDFIFNYFTLPLGFWVCARAGERGGLAPHGTWYVTQVIT